MRAEKQFLFNEIDDQIESYQNFIISDCKGQLANDTAAFRVQLREAGGEMEVVRKRILSKVLDSRGVKVELDNLPGHICLVYTGKDSASVAKCLLQAQKSGLKSEVLSGYFEGKVISKEQVKFIATLPSKDEMRAQLLATFTAPMSQTLSVVNALLTSVPHCLANKAKEQ